MRRDFCIGLVLTAVLTSSCLEIGASRGSASPASAWVQPHVSATPSSSGTYMPIGVRLGVFGKIPNARDVVLRPTTPDLALTAMAVLVQMIAVPMLFLATMSKRSPKPRSASAKRRAKALLAAHRLAGWGAWLAVKTVIMDNSGSTLAKVLDKVVALVGVGNIITTRIILAATSCFTRLCRLCPSLAILFFMVAAGLVSKAVMLPSSSATITIMVSKAITASYAIITILVSCVMEHLVTITMITTGVALTGALVLAHVRALMAKVAQLDGDLKLASTHNQRQAALIHTLTEEKQALANQVQQYEEEEKARAAAVASERAAAVGLSQAAPAVHKAPHDGDGGGGAPGPRLSEVSVDVSTRQDQVSFTPATTGSQPTGFPSAPASPASFPSSCGLSSWCSSGPSSSSSSSYTASSSSCSSPTRSAASTGTCTPATSSGGASASSLLVMGCTSTTQTASATPSSSTSTQTASPTSPTSATTATCTATQTASPTQATCTSTQTASTQCDAAAQTTPAPASSTPVHSASTQTASAASAATQTAPAPAVSSRTTSTQTTPAQRCIETQTASTPAPSTTATSSQTTPTQTAVETQTATSPVASTTTTSSQTAPVLCAAATQTASDAAVPAHATSTQTPLAATAATTSTQQPVPTPSTQPAPTPSTQQSGPEAAPWSDPLPFVAPTWEVLSMGYMHRYVPDGMNRFLWCHEDYQEQELIYTGIGGSTVHKARCIQSGATVVLKKYDLDCMPSQFILDEIHTHALCHHKNIVQFYGAFYNGQCVWIVMEYVQHGNLASYMQGQGWPQLSEFMASKVSKQLLSALDHTHKKGILHRDIKSTNILVVPVDGAAPDVFDIKLCDFGFACFAASQPMEALGTPGYYPPEVHEAPWLGPYGLPADVYLVGATLFHLITNLSFNYPRVDTSQMDEAGRMTEEFDERRHNHDVQQLLQDGLSPIARKFILSTVRRQAAERPTVQELLADPFITGA